MTESELAVQSVCQRELRYLHQMLQAGALIAVPAALYHCRKYKIPLPVWLGESATDLLMAHVMKAGALGRKGRASGIVTRHRQNMVQFARHDVVMYIREGRARSAADISELEGLHGARAEALLQDRLKLQAWLGRNNEAAFECAEFLLEGTDAAGKPGAIKQSYDTVERESKDPLKAMKYHMLDPQFERHVGAYVNSSFQVGKFKEFYDSIENEHAPSSWTRRINRAKRNRNESAGSKEILGGGSS